MAAVGVPMRTLQEWMGHRDFTTTLVYADFAPDPAGGAAFAERAFGNKSKLGGGPTVPAYTDTYQRLPQYEIPGNRHLP
jgi:integrase